MGGSGEGWVGVGREKGGVEWGSLFNSHGVGLDGQGRLWMLGLGEGGMAGHACAGSSPYLPRSLPDAPLLANFGFSCPLQDLPPPGESDSWVYDLPHKDTKQLLRLALAQAEAEVEAPPPVDAKGGKPGAAAGAKPAAGAAGAKAGAAAGGKGKDAAPVPDRPYSPGEWALPAGEEEQGSAGRSVLLLQGT